MPSEASFFLGVNTYKTPRQRLQCWDSFTLGPRTPFYHQAAQPRPGGASRERASLPLLGNSFGPPHWPYEVGGIMAAILQQRN